MTARSLLPLVSAAFVGMASSALAVPLDYLALYTFEDGTASDQSGNGNDGSVVAGVTFEGAGSGYDGGRAASFAPVLGASGINTGIDINAATLPALTMGAWISVDSAASSLATVLSHDNGSYDRSLTLDTRGGSSAISAFTGSGVLAGTAYSADDWMHVAVSYDGTATSLYVNGVLANTGADDTDFDSSTYPLFIGANPGYNEDFTGLIDDVFVYGRALGEGEIADIYANGFGVSPVPLPAGLPLLAGALGLIGIARRRQRG